jgi:hypothetical protein
MFACIFLALLDASRSWLLTCCPCCCGLVAVGAAVEEFLQVGLPGMGAGAQLLPSLEELDLPTAAELEAAAKPQVKQEQVRAAGHMSRPSSCHSK